MNRARGHISAIKGDKRSYRHRIPAARDAGSRVDFGCANKHWERPRRSAEPSRVSIRSDELRP